MPFFGFSKTFPPISSDDLNSFRLSAADYWFIKSHCFGAMKDWSVDNAPAK